MPHLFSPHEFSTHGLEQLIVRSEQLQERSLKIHDKTARTSGLIAKTTEWSHGLVLRMGRAEPTVFESRLSRLRECLHNQEHHLNAVALTLESAHGSSDQTDRVAAKASILVNLREFDALTTVLRQLAGEAIVDVHGELNDGLSKRWRTAT